MDGNKKDLNELEVDVERALSESLAVLPLPNFGGGGSDNGSLLNEGAGGMVVEVKLTALDTYVTYSSR